MKTILILIQIFTIFKSLEAQFPGQVPNGQPILGQQPYPQQGVGMQYSNYMMNPSLTDQQRYYMAQQAQMNGVNPVPYPQSAAALQQQQQIQPQPEPNLLMKIFNPGAAQNFQQPQTTAPPLFGMFGPPASTTPPPFNPFAFLSPTTTAPNFLGINFGKKK